MEITRIKQHLKVSHLEILMFLVCVLAKTESCKPPTKSNNKEFIFLILSLFNRS